MPTNIFLPFYTPDCYQAFLSIGQHSNCFASLLQVDQEHQDMDDVRHYDFQGDQMSAGSLSSLASGEWFFVNDII